MGPVHKSQSLRIKGLNPHTGTGDPDLPELPEIVRAHVIRIHLHGHFDRLYAECPVQVIEDLLQLTWRKKGDRKSTRLNSSHVAISYAVFCLKKKRYTGI